MVDVMFSSDREHLVYSDEAYGRGRDVSQREATQRLADLQRFSSAPLPCTQWMLCNIFHVLSSQHPKTKDWQLIVHCSRLLRD